MRNKFFKICSIILVATLLVNMLPMSVFAEEFRESLANQEVTAPEAETAVTENTYVVDELEEKRTEFSKEFLLSNGLHMATVYTDAVHYETENGWEEIDNTLKANSDGTLSNTAGVWDVRFPQQLSKDKSITIEKDGYTLSFFMTGELNSDSGAMVMSADKVATPMAVKNSRLAAAEVRTLDLTAAREAAEFEEVVLEKTQSQLAYADVYENTDVVYDLDSNRVKESVILKHYSSTLRGYQYVLEVGDMLPVLAEDGQITFYDKTGETVIMVMPAPFMVDDAGNRSDDVNVLLEGSEGSYTMRYLLPQDWLASPERAWPVVLDPIVETDLERSNIRDVTVSSKITYSNNWGMNSCGWRTDDGITRTYLKYRELPALKSSDVVVAAGFGMYRYAGSSNATTVEVHKVNGLWESEDLIWKNQDGSPDDEAYEITFDPIVEDYAIVNNYLQYSWDVTDIVQDWYKSGNTGMMFKAPDSVEQGNTKSFKQFISADFGTETYRPTLLIKFRNNNGLESYWDYTSASAGRAGTGYVNNFTGNMVWIRNDIGFDGNLMPVSINHIYNANDAADDLFGLGYGWRTNYNQLVYQWTTDTDYYVWEDDDGTDHYFEHSSANTYKDEDNLELVLTTGGSGEQTYCITDKNGNKSYFDQHGRLRKMQNNQQTPSSVTICYTTETGKRISSVTDGAGRVYKFVYDGNYLTQIDYHSKGESVYEDNSVGFGYSGGKLIRVTYKDGEECHYTYNATNGLLESAQDIDGYKLTYEYNTVTNTSQPYRVKKVTESDGEKLGGELSIAYDHNQTTFTDYKGNVEIHQFNNSGSTTCIQDDEGRAHFGAYKPSASGEFGNSNQLTLSSKLQTTVGNVARDADFEDTQIWAPNNSALTLERTNETSYGGSYSLKMVNTASDTVAALTNGFYVDPGATYTFSAYVKTSGTPAIIALQNGATYQTKTGNHIASGQDWTRAQVSYTNTSSESLRITPILFLTAAGTAYMDNVQIERSPTASRLNIIENGDFHHTEYGGYSWSRNELDSADGPVTLDKAPAPQLDSNAFKITGNPTGYKQLIQYVPRSGSAGDSYVLAGWAMGNSVPLKKDSSNPRDFEIEAVLHYHDGTSNSATLQFNPDSDVWQYASSAVAATKAYFSITVIIRYNFNANTVYFDGIQLFKEEFGTSYTYDDKGNVISTQDLQKQTTNYEYDTSGNLTKILQNNRAKMTYTYDDYHNVKTATTDESVVYEFEYDPYGNNKKVSIVNGENRISSSATYSSDGNRLVSTTDALDKTTHYNYNENTNVLDSVQYPEDTEGTKTSYTYDDMYRTARAACTTDTGLAQSVEYTYENDNLKTVTTPSTTYNFEYGDFGQRARVNVGNTTLASYDYGDIRIDGNRNLKSLSYGNGDFTIYDYDKKGRKTLELYDGLSFATYAYDNSGALAEMQDSAIGRTTKYFYDLTDRLMKYEESGTGFSHSVGYTYDEKNNLTQQVETINGVAHTESYEYDEDNRIKKLTSGDTVTEYTYDNFSRLSQRAETHQNTPLLKETYSYTGNSTQVASVSLFLNGAENATVTYSYSYDDNGNITEVKQIGADEVILDTTSYVYDSANQLLRENNQKEGRTWTWTYDNAGNILSKSEYNYTPAEESLVNETPLDTVSYIYNDEDWGDLLKEYDGVEIESDEIGNLETYGNRSFTWTRGRQLETMTLPTDNGTKTWTYTYDANGMRTKRTDETTTYEYVYNGSQLTHVMIGFIKVYITYDASGKPLTLNVLGSDYYYETNLQGDVIGIYNSNGNKLVEYTYDAWGKILSITDNSTYRIGILNPLRYRGYVYDDETGFYYLQSRYYDPKLGRFINADAFTSTGQDLLGNNMFAYCGNNPVVSADPTGQIPVAVIAEVAYVACAALVLTLAVGFIKEISKPEIQSQISSTIADVKDRIENSVKEVYEFSRSIAKKLSQIQDETPQVHHIVPVGKFSNRAIETQQKINEMHDVLNDAGINRYIDPVNLVLVSRKTHSRLHTDAYITHVHSYIMGAAGSKEQIYLALFALRLEIAAWDVTAAGY